MSMSVIQVKVAHFEKVVCAITSKLFRILTEDKQKDFSLGSIGSIGIVNISEVVAK